MPILSNPEVDEALEDSTWQREGEKLVRAWKLENFVSAMSFVNRVAEAAEAANHHPDILIHSWNQVRLELSTHSEGGITRSDLDLALRIDQLV